MKDKDFDKVLKRRIGLITSVLSVKAKEYVRNDDRLHNFNRGSSMLGVTPESVCIGFMAKHLISILDLVRDVEEGKSVSMSTWDEKLGDAINYLILLEAIVNERENPELLEGTK